MSTNNLVPREPILPKHGVITLFGYGSSVHVENGHLILEDGVGRFAANLDYLVLVTN